MANRTESGAPSQAAREQYGTSDGRFPIFDRKSALNALKLRGHAKNATERRNIIRRAAKYAPQQAADALQADKDSGAL